MSKLPESTTTSAMQSDDAKADLHRQLAKLGDMLGDGDAEPWVGKEYRRICKALGYTSNRRRVDPARKEAINTAMAKRVSEVKCPKCSGQLKQTRSGSMIADCTQCDGQYTLLKAKKGKARGKS